MHKAVLLECLACCCRFFFLYVNFCFSTVFFRFSEVRFFSWADSCTARLSRGTRLCRRFTKLKFQRKENRRKKGGLSLRPQTQYETGNLPFFASFCSPLLNHSSQFQCVNKSTDLRNVKYETIPPWCTQQIDTHTHTLTQQMKLPIHSLFVLLLFYYHVFGTMLIFLIYYDKFCSYW